MFFFRKKLGASQKAATPEISNAEVPQDDLDKVVGGVQAARRSSESEDEVSNSVANAAAQQIAAFNATYVDGLSASDIRSLGARIANFNDAALASIDANQLASASLSALSHHQLGLLTAEQLAGVTANQLADLSASQVAALGGDIGGLSASALGRLSATQVDAMTVPQVAALDEKVAHLSSSALQSLDAAQFSAVSSAGIAAMDNAHFRALLGEDGSRVRLLSAEQVDGLSSAQLGSLGARIADLSEAALGSLDAKQLAACAVHALSDRQIASLSADQLGALTTEQCGRLGADQLTGVSAAQVAHLEGAQVRALGLAVTGLSSSARAGLDRNELTFAQLDALGWTQPFVNLPPSQSSRRDSDERESTSSRFERTPSHSEEDAEDSEHERLRSEAEDEAETEDEHEHEHEDEDEDEDEHEDGHEDEAEPEQNVRLEVPVLPPAPGPELLPQLPDVIVLRPPSEVVLTLAELAEPAEPPRPEVAVQVVPPQWPEGEPPRGEVQRPPAQEDDPAPRVVDARGERAGREEDEGPDDQARLVVADVEAEDEDDSDDRGDREVTLALPDLPRTDGEDEPVVVLQTPAQDPALELPPLSPPQTPAQSPPQLLSELPPELPPPSPELLPQLPEVIVLSPPSDVVLTLAELDVPPHNPEVHVQILPPALPDAPISPVAPITPIAPIAVTTVAVAAAQPPTDADAAPSGMQAGVEMASIPGNLAFQPDLVSPAQLSSWTQAQVAESGLQLIHLPAATLAALRPEQVSALSPVQMVALGARAAGLGLSAVAAWDPFVLQSVKGAYEYASGSAGLVAAASNAHSAPTSAAYAAGMAQGLWFIPMPEVLKEAIDFMPADTARAVSPGQLLSQLVHQGASEAGPEDFLQRYLASAAGGLVASRVVQGKTELMDGVSDLFSRAEPGPVRVESLVEDAACASCRTVLPAEGSSVASPAFEGVVMLGLDDGGQIELLSFIADDPEAAAGDPPGR